MGQGLLSWPMAVTVSLPLQNSQGFRVQEREVVALSSIVQDNAFDPRHLRVSIFSLRPTKPPDLFYLQHASDPELPKPLVHPPGSS